MISRCSFLLFLSSSSVRSRLRLTQTDSCCRGSNNVSVASTSHCHYLADPMIPCATRGMKSRVSGKHNGIKTGNPRHGTVRPPLNWIVIPQFSSLRRVSIAISSLTRGIRWARERWGEAPRGTIMFYISRGEVGTVLRAAIFQRPIRRLQLYKESSREGVSSVLITGYLVKSLALLLLNSSNQIDQMKLNKAIDGEEPTAH